MISPLHGMLEASLSHTKAIRLKRIDHSSIAPKEVLPARATRYRSLAAVSPSVDVDAAGVTGAADNSGAASSSASLVGSGEFVSCTRGGCVAECSCGMR